MEGLSGPHSKGGNCEKDRGHLLTDLRDFVENGKTNLTSDDSISVDNLLQELNNPSLVTSEPGSCGNENLSGLYDDDVKIIHFESKTTDSFEEGISKSEVLSVSLLASQIAETVLKENQCSECFSAFYYCHLPQIATQSSLGVELSQGFMDTVQQAMNIFRSEIIPNGLHHANIRDICIATMTVGCDFQ